MPAELPFVIVGAGPVGLVLALLLAREGLPVTLLEAEADIAEELRASTFHPPTLDMLDRLGLAAPLIARGLVTPTWQVRLHATGEAAVFDLSVLAEDTAHPYRLQCEQNVLSRLLLAELAVHPHAEIRFGTKVTAVRQSADSASVTLDDGDVLTGSFVIGCDGARSIVRRTLGLEFAGETYPETMILATTRHDFSQDMPGLSNVNYVWTEHEAFSGNFSLLRVPGRWRASLYPAPGETVEQARTPEAIERKLQAIAPQPAPYEVLEMRAYRIHQRIVPQYRVGRLALAGDAAHLNSPSGGMGMNGGIHDAFALADALIAIARGGDLTLLDRYTRLRQPIAAEQILSQANQNRSRMRERDPQARRRILDDMRRTAADPVKARAHLLKSSMIEGLRQAAQMA